MPIPGTIATRDIHVSIAEFNGDSSEGTVTFTNTHFLYDETGNVILAPGAYSAALVSGEATITVPTTDAAGIFPLDRTLRVNLSLDSGWAARYFIEVPTGVGTLELADIPQLLSAGVAPSSAFAQILEDANEYTDAAAALKVNKAGDTMTGPLLVAHNGYNVDLTHDLSIASSTGIAYTNGPLTAASSTSVNIPAGVAVFSHHSFSEQSFSTVNYGPTVVTIDDLSDPLTYFMINEAGAVVQNAGVPTREQRRDYAILGRAVVLGSVISNVQDSPVLAKHPHSFTHDMLSAIGAIRVDGIRATAIASSMTFSLTGGNIFNPGANYQFNEKDPNVSPFNAVTPASFRYVTQSGIVDVTPRTAIDPTIYDVGGVVTAVGGSGAFTTIQRVHCFPTQNVFIQLGQNTYSTLANALDALAVGETLPFTTHPDLRGGGVLTAFIIAQRSTTNLADTTVARVARATRFGDPGGL